MKWPPFGDVPLLELYRKAPLVFGNLLFFLLYIFFIYILLVNHCQLYFIRYVFFLLDNYNIFINYCIVTVTIHSFDHLLYSVVLNCILSISFSVLISVIIQWDITSWFNLHSTFSRVTSSLIYCWWFI